MISLPFFFKVAGNNFYCYLFVASLQSYAAHLKVVCKANDVAVAVCCCCDRDEYHFVPIGVFTFPVGVNGYILFVFGITVIYKL